MKILVMNRKYDGIFGGVEYMSTTLVNEMAQRGHECHLLSLDQNNAVMGYDLHRAVQWHKIANISADRKAGWGERWSRFLRIRNILQTHKIDVAIGFQDGAYLSLVTAAIGTDCAVIAAERNSPSRFNFIKAGRLKNLTFNSFRLAKYITVQCPSYVDQYPPYLRNKIEVIPNPVFPIEEQNLRKKSDAKTRKILSVGRLSYQKNYSVLVRSFADLAPEFPDWNLVIVGDGEGRKDLESLIHTLNLSERIKLAGYDEMPQKHYLASDIFCLPSRWEGFPNALAEAMQCGLPCVGFEECSGVSDLITHEKTGLLANGNGNVDTLKLSLERLMRHDELRSEMGRRAQEYVAQYAPSVVFDVWENLFIRINKEK